MALLGNLPATYPLREAYNTSPWLLPQPESEHQESPQFGCGLNAERSLDCTATSGP